MAKRRIRLPVSSGAWPAFLAFVALSIIFHFVTERAAPSLNIFRIGREYMFPLPYTFFGGNEGAPLL